MEVLEVGPAEALEVRSAVFLVEEDTGTCLSLTGITRILKFTDGWTYLADALKRTDGMLEIANMEYRDTELDVCIVSHTIYG
jgi:hypothetical protein